MNRRGFLGTVIAGITTALWPKERGAQAELSLDTPPLLQAIKGKTPRNSLIAFADLYVEPKGPLRIPPLRTGEPWVELSPEMFGILSYQNDAFGIKTVHIRIVTGAETIFTAARWHPGGFYWLIDEKTNKHLRANILWGIHHKSG